MGWLTLVVALAPDADRERRVAERLESAGVVAQARLVDAGAGEGMLWVLGREAWKEVAEANEPAVRAFRVWDAIVGREKPDARAYVSLAVDLTTTGLDFDDPTVTGALRETLASYLPLLGIRFIATSTLMSDWMHCAGALTAFWAGSDTLAAAVAAADPWRTVAPSRLYRLQPLVVRSVPPPAGPGTQRYGASNPWPGGSFSE
jgi:hypothetical protein